MLIKKGWFGMKWLLDNIWWIAGFFTAILIILFIIAILKGEFNTIVRIIIVPVTAVIAILTTIGWREHNREKNAKKALTSIKNELEYQSILWVFSFFLSLSQLHKSNHGLMHLNKGN